MENRERPGAIGLLDSGMGGLTVLAALTRYLPGERFIYFADTARLPYGPRPRAEVREFALQILAYLGTRRVKAAVIACNTASAAVLAEARRCFGFPIIEPIEAGARLAAGVTRTGRIGLLATEGTLKSGVYDRALGRLVRGLKLVSRPCPELVMLVERGRRGSDGAVWVVNRCLAPLLDARVDVVILGCTHLPFLTGVMRELVGPGVMLVDPAEEMARRLAEAVTAERQAGYAESGQEGSPARHEFLVTGDPVLFTRTAGKLLGVAFPMARQVSLAGPGTEHATTRLRAGG